MLSFRWWSILAYYFFVFIAIIYFNSFLKIKTGEGLFGRFNIKIIPKKLIWVFIVGNIGSFIMLFFPITYLIYPKILNNTFPIYILDNFKSSVAGLFLIVTGLTLTIISLIHLGISARFLLPKQKTKLIKSGLYRFCRNPIYLGLYISFIGIFFVAPSLLYLIGFLLFLINNHFRILQEEKYLLSSFGKEYKNYSKLVGRYFPKTRKNYD